MKAKCNTILKTVSLRLPEDVLIMLAEDAKSNLRNMTNQICVILTEYTKNKRRSRRKVQLET